MSGRHAAERVTAPVSTVERLTWLRHTARRWIFALTLLVVALLVGSSWTLGLFSSRSANLENVVSAGSMTQDSTADNTAIMSASDIVPGSVVTGTVTIRNVGDASGDFTLNVEDIEDDPGKRGGKLSSRLKLKVFDADVTRPVYSGRLNGLHVSLGTWRPDEQRTYDFEVRMPNQRASADNPYQGSSVTATFVWSAVQSQ